MTAPEPTVIMTGLEVAMDIYLDGLTTGISSALASFAAHETQDRRDWSMFGGGNDCPIE